MTATHDIINPATEQVVTTVELLRRGADRRRDRPSPQGVPGLAEVAPGDRARLLRRFAEAVDADPNTWPSSRS